LLPVSVLPFVMAYYFSFRCWLEFYRLFVDFFGSRCDFTLLQNRHLSWKFQILIFKLQITMTKTQRVVVALAAASAYLLDSAFGTSAATTFDICSLEIFWDLGFGIWCL